MEDIAYTLLSWYDTHHRSLPWRATADPYAIWISETILQQTRVVQGYDYYLRFMREFPTVEALAAADEDRVLRVWQGLGYYSRARNLLQAARQVMEVGGFPCTFEGLRQLKGVGDYTAAAIGSFAFGLPVAVVDGNVYRVLSRLFAVDEPIDTSRGKSLFADLAQQLLPPEYAARYNQAVMEFGALQCVPRHPDCSCCPLADKCLARAQGRVEELPVKQHRTKVSERFFDYCLVHDGQSLYLHKRVDDDIWRGLYELPLRETSERLPAETLAGWGLQLPVSLFQLRGSRKHVLSHQHIHATLYEAVVEPPLPYHEDYIIIRKEELDNYPLPRLITMLLE